MRCGVLLFLMLLNFSAYSDFSSGERAYKQRNYQKAFEELKPLADSGHIDAQLYVGRMYIYGFGEPTYIIVEVFVDI